MAKKFFVGHEAAVGVLLPTAHPPRSSKAEKSAREAQSQRELQVFHRSQNLRCGAAAVGAAGLDHAGEESIDCTMVGIEESPTLRGNLVQLLPTLAGADRHITKLLEESQRRIDDAWTGAVGSGDLLLNRLDKLIAVPGLLGDELQDDQAKVAMGEEAAEASSASLPTMRTAVVVFVLAVFYAAEATAVAFVMGMSVVH